MTKSGDRFFCRGHHNHENEEDEVGRIAVENECKRRAAAQPERPRLIFEQARQALVVTSLITTFMMVLFMVSLFLKFSHPNATIGFNQNIERNIQRARRRLQPPIPQSFDEAERSLQESAFYRCILIFK